jgi:pilus assembly protein CpaF
MEGETVTMQEVFSYKQSGVDAEGKVVGHFRASGVRPKFMDRLRAFGVNVPDAVFDPTQRYE